jgi:hypothetical protein
MDLLSSRTAGATQSNFVSKKKKKKRFIYIHECFACLYVGVHLLACHWNQQKSDPTELALQF